MIEVAVAAARVHDVRAIDNAVTVLTRGPIVDGEAGGPAGHALVDGALGRHLVEAVGNAWGRGWQPADLVRVVERQLGRAHGRLAVAAVVHDTARYEPSMVPPRWRAQVDDLAANGPSGPTGRGAAAGSARRSGRGEPPGGTDRADAGVGADASGAPTGGGADPSGNGHGGAATNGGDAGPAGDGDASPGSPGAAKGADSRSSDAGPPGDGHGDGGPNGAGRGRAGQPGPGRSGDGDDDRWAVPVRDGDRRAAVMTAVETLALVRRLPDVPKLGPAPGDARVGVAAGAAGEGGGPADPRILHRVRSLLAKAESTTFPEEAEALTAKAQELMARHAIDAAVLEAERGTGPDVAARRLAVDDPYAAPKAILLEAIASANRCRSVWSKGYGYATVFGAEGDLDAVELLYTSLLVQAARAMLSEGPGSARGPKGAGRTRSFRQSFLVAFATRIGARLREAVEAATDAYAEEHDNLLPVLAERRDAAEAACEEAFPHVRSTSVSANDWWGWRAGHEAAEAAQLDLHAAVGGATS
ncbi:MAG TPA: DUF2786 domain-containing protein [Acidimicrobiales bacterium]